MPMTAISTTLVPKCDRIRCDCTNNPRDFNGWAGPTNRPFQTNQSYLAAISNSLEFIPIPILRFSTRVKHLFSEHNSFLDPRSNCLRILICSEP